MNREESRKYADQRALAWRMWPEGIAKLAAWLLLLLVFSTMTLGMMPEVERPSATPEHATIGLVAGVLLIVLWIAMRRVRECGKPGGGIGKRRGDSPARWLHYRLRRTLLLVFAVVIASGVLSAAVSPLAVRLWDTGFDLASLAAPSPSRSALGAGLHHIAALLLVAAIVLEAGFVIWRALRLRDGALLRILPFGVLWQRLAAQDRRLRERMPSRHIGNWPRGRTL